MEIALNKMQSGQKGTITSIKVDGKLKRRLFDMGITPGAPVVMCKVAPLGDPIEITLRGYKLTLRKSEAQDVYVLIQEAK